MPQKFSYQQRRYQKYEERQKPKDDIPYVTNSKRKSDRNWGVLLRNLFTRKAFLESLEQSPSASS